MMMPIENDIAHSGYTGSDIRQFGAKRQEYDRKDQARNRQTGQDDGASTSGFVNARFR